FGRTGQPFWQDESFDRYLRRSSQIERTIDYIENNPVSARLVGSPESWPWSSAGWQAKPPAPPKANSAPGKTVETNRRQLPAFTEVWRLAKPPRVDNPPHNSLPD